MSQHDFDIANQGFAAFRADLNNALKALGSVSSGTEAPTTTYANQLWYETDTNTLHIRNEANSAWLDLMVIDQTTGSPSFTAGNVGIGTDSPTAKLHVASGGSPADLELKFDTGAGATSANLVDFNHSRSAGNFTFSFAGTERMRIDSSGNVGIGTTTPTSPLHIYLTDATTYGAGTAALDTTNILRVQNDSQVNDTYSGIQLVSENGAGTTGMWTIASVSTSSNYDNHLVFHTRTGSTTYGERARITSDGDFLVGKTASSFATVGVQLVPDGQIGVTRDSQNCLNVNRLTNDGGLVNFQQASITEGSISVSGTTVSYNGGHLSRWAQFPDNSRPELLKGTVMSNLDQMSNWDNEDNEQLNCVQVSTVEGDANVAGVFVAWDSTDDGYNDILLAMTGDMVIRIGAGVTVARGDLLMSAGDGTAKPQGDDIVRSKTIAKVTSTHVSHTYADGSYAVPCVLMAC